MESIKEFKPILEVECQCHRDFYSDIEGLGYATERSFRAYSNHQRDLQLLLFGVREFPLTDDKFGMDLLHANEGLLVTIVRDSGYNILSEQDYSLEFCLVDYEVRK